MEASEDYAVFVHYGIPVIAKIASKLYQKLVEMDKAYFKGSIMSCEKLADDIVAVTEFEMA